MAVEPAQSDAPSDVQVFPPFTVTADNLGPIEHAEVTLKPLTVFIGPNGSGKTHMATLINGVMPNEGRLMRSGPASSRLEARLPQAVRSVLDTALAQGMGATLGPDVSQPVARDAAPAIWWQSVRDWVLRAYSAPHLRRRGATGPGPAGAAQTPSLQCTFDLAEDSFDAEMSGEPPVVVLAPFARGGDPGHVNVVVPPHARAIMPFPSRSDDPEARDSLIRGGLALASAAWLTHERPPVVWHLPASRSGLVTLQSHLYAALLEVALREEQAAPRYGTVVRDYLGQMAQLGDETHDLADIVDLYEERLVGGKIITGPRGPGEVAPVRLLQGELQLPATVMSSAALELAPVILYLRQYVRPGHLFILEEPEAHLHPANQRLMARLLARLVRAGVRVLITTHSEYLLSQLSNLVFAGALEERWRSALSLEGMSPDEYLRDSEVAVYLFDEGAGDAPGFVARLLEPAPEGGISRKEFTAVARALNRERVALEGARWGDDNE